MPHHRSATDIAWAAGLFEGEGCLNISRKASGSVKGQMRLAMSDRDVVEKFAAVIGCGNIHFRDSQKAHWKPTWTWCLYEAEKLREVLPLLMPHFGTRRYEKSVQVLETIKYVNPHYKKMTCPDGHPYSGDNLIEEPIVRNGKSYIARRCRTCRNGQANKRNSMKGVASDD